MAHISDILDEIVRVQGRVRDALEAALQDGRFREVAILARLAEQLSQVSADGGNDGEQQEQKPNTPMLAGALNPRTSSRQSRGAGPSSRHQGASYPRFVATDGGLVKVGWSPKSESEYRHRVEREAIDRLVVAIAAFAGSKRLFKVADIGDNAEVPSYQVHTLFAWLRHCGLVVQHGRRGYSLSKPRAFNSEVNTAFALLPVEDATAEQLEHEDH